MSELAKGAGELRFQVALDPVSGRVDTIPGPVWRRLRASSGRPSMRTHHRQAGSTRRSWVPGRVRAGEPSEGRPNRLRVLMATPSYLPEIGGVENHVHAVATRIADSGEASVTVLTTDLDGRLPPTEVDGAVTVRRVRGHPRSRDWRFAPAIGREVAGGSWDVVHVQSYHTFVAPLAMAAAARAGIPYVLTFHGGGHSDRLRHRARRLQRSLLRPLLTRAAALVALARFEIELYSRELRLPASRFVLIPNGFDLPVITGNGLGPVVHPPRGR